MRRIERRAFQSEAMSLCLGAACKLWFLEQAPENKESVEPSTKEGIEPVRLCASPFQAHLSIGTVPSGLCYRETQNSAMTVNWTLSGRLHSIRNFLATEGDGHDQAGYDDCFELSCIGGMVGAGAGQG